MNPINIFETMPLLFKSQKNFKSSNQYSCPGRKTEIAPAPASAPAGAPESVMIPMTPMTRTKVQGGSGYRPWKATGT